ncbi:MAG: DUF3551 domain-containing protein [Hyphomicrobiales bacterium]|nr:DUF3551 domain-containing protein [Hyphomicrobiales bacterium]
MRTTRTVLALLVLGLVCAVDVGSAAAETYRPWCAQYTGRSSGRNCGFVSYEQCMMTATPGSGAICVQNPWYLWYGDGSGRKPRNR